MKRKTEVKTPRKVGYLKYLKLKEKELGTQHSLEQVGTFEHKYRPWGLVYFFHCLPRYLRDMRDRYKNYKIEHLKIGRQKWRDGQLYIKDIPYYIASETAAYLMAIIRDYLREYAKITYSIGNSLTEKDGKENNCFYVRAVGFGDGDGLDEWRGKVNEVADKFNEAAELHYAAVSQRDLKDGMRLWGEYRRSVSDAFDMLKVIFHDLEE